MRFELKATNGRNEVVSLRFEAANEAAAREQAEQKGYAVFAVSGGVLDLGGWRGRGGFPATLFSIELLALLDAGLNVVEALRTLAESDRPTEQRMVVAGLVRALEEGASFSQAIARYPEHFSPLYAATVRSSERTGGLKEALGRHVSYQEELDRVHKKIVTASIYPAILLGVGALVLLFLVFYVVPRFARVYEDAAVALPFFSAVLLGVGRWVGNHEIAIALALAAFATLAIFAASHPGLRAAAGERLWSIPGFGARLKAYQLGRLYRTLGMLLRAGVPIVSAMDMVSSLLAAHLRPSLARARALLAEGKAVSAAFAGAALAPPVALRMLRVGEESGQMGEMMDRVARFLDDESTRFVEAFLRVFEPALMAFLGVAVGLVVVLMYMPIFELAGSLQ